MTSATGGPLTIFEDVRTLEAPEGGAVVVLRGGTIEAEGSASGSRPAAASGERVAGGGRWLLPGWIDLQVNDIEWLARGPRDPSSQAERIRDVLSYQVQRGTTGVVLATLAAPEEEVLSYLEGAALVRSGGGPLDSAFRGALVEGTFMNPALCGAHNPVHVRRPERGLLERLLATGGMRLINIAPETSPEALELIALAAGRGVVVGCGHAKPSGKRVREAVEAGLAYVIHLGNGPTGSSLKGFSDGGLLEEALRNDRLLVTLILDGVHLDPRLVRDIVARKELQRVVGISDAGFAAGVPRGEFATFGVRGAVSPDGRYLQVLPPAGAPPPNPLSSDAAVLYGSAVGMREVFQNVLNWLSVEMEGIYHRRHPALPFVEALRAAVEVASANPARLLGERRRGRVRSGFRADLVLAAIGGGPGSYRVTVERVWLGGREVRAEAPRPAAPGPAGPAAGGRP